MIERVANNKFNTEQLNLNTPAQVKEKLDYYRSLFNKIEDFSEEEFEKLKKDIAYFFNLKPVGSTDTPPPYLVRISNNNRILHGKELSYLTDISQLLAPPVQFCNFGRCNIPAKQVLYCAVNEAGAYWEAKPKNGDVITLSHFELKKGAKVNCNVIKTEKTANPKISHDLQEVFYLLEEFFVDVFSLEIDRNRPKDYLFSALLASEQLFYPVVASNNIEAIIYPSVQKKKHGQNFAIRNDLILERYNLIGVETRFITNEYDNIDPATDELTTDNIIGSFGTKKFDFKMGKILYQFDKANEVFKLFRDMQLSGNQIRAEGEIGKKNLAFDLSPKTRGTIAPQKIAQKKYGRNDRVNVVYQNGTRKDNIQHKKVEEDLKKGICKIINY